ncbi:helix-turn-helix domain-containing protein [Sunxiuqinia indica]|uniref:helix-turn-helix domain-containing protein n=1 Tax=Sunxiuqinia indica TaxID=2692584 RepID=UPI001356F83A|nr:helix-turn-helix transcriptional regulator [Sunxiuqinia indica]
MVIGDDKNEFLYLFGERLKHLRMDKKLSFRQLAQNCNLDYSDISKIEKGERNIQLSTVLELAKGLGVQPKDLFYFEIKISKD